MLQINIDLKSIHQDKAFKLTCLWEQSIVKFKAYYEIVVKDKYFIQLLRSCTESLNDSK